MIFFEPDFSLKPGESKFGNYKPKRKDTNLGELFVYCAEKHPFGSNYLSVLFSNLGSISLRSLAYCIPRHFELNCGSKLKTVSANYIPFASG